MTCADPKETFNEVLEFVGECLRPLGFKRRGAVFRVFAHGNCGIIEFQRSMNSSKDRLLFTLNVGVVYSGIMDSEAPLQDLQKARSIHTQIRWRIGEFLPGLPDKWWEIRKDTDPKLLGQEVLDLILQTAVPEVERHLETDSIISLWESGQSPGLTDGRRMELLRTLKAKQQDGDA